jgi:hypothetical protein
VSRGSPFPSASAASEPILSASTSRILRQICRNFNKNQVLN